MVCCRLTAPALELEPQLEPQKEDQAKNGIAAGSKDGEKKEESPAKRAALPGVFSIFFPFENLSLLTCAQCALATQFRGQLPAALPVPSVRAPAI